MGDILAIISKAQFEAAHGSAKVGDALAFTQYVSSHAALEPVREGGSIFLVTVRPPDERLWLLAELVHPKHDGKAWTSKPSSAVVKDITAAIPQLRFANGKGLAPKKGALGMSLQTPRLLTESDVALLRGKPAQKVAAAVPPERSREGGLTASSPARAQSGLGAVLEEWRATRAPELEKLIDTLSQHHARAYPQLDPEAADYDAAWTARAADATPESLAHLLPGLWSDPRGSIPLRLRKLLDLGADPRLGAALLKMIADPPLTASSNFSAWTVLFKALPSMVDTRARKQLNERAKKKGGDSQFWPKLTAWIEGALEKLPEPAALSKDQLASVAKRQKEAEALLKGPPPASAKAEKPAAPAPMKGSPRETLELAVAELGGGRPLGALEPLRLYWEVTREPAAAELMARIGKAASAAQPRFDGGKASAVHAAWMKAGKRFDAPQVTPLLDALTAGTLADAEERLELMFTWPADPRVAEAMVGLIDPARTRTGAYIGARPQLWKRTYDLLVRNADPRFTAALQQNATRLEAAAQFDRNRAERPHASRTIVPYVEASSKGRKPSPDEQALLGRLAAMLDSATAKLKASRKPEEELGLLKAIIGAPEDDTPKLVYADFLTERGDVRGEFINLSISLARGGKVKSKLEAFVKRHKRAIEGPLAGMARELPLGFFDAAGFGYSRATPKDAELRELVEDLRWVTVRKLTMPRDEANRAGEALLTSGPLYALQELHDVTGPQLALAAARDFPWALRLLALRGNALDARVKGSAFPMLEELQLAMWPAPPPTLWEAPLLQAVERLTMGAPNMYGEFPADELILHAPRLEKLKSISVRTSSVSLDVAKSGDGRVDATLTLSAQPSTRDDYFLKLLERLKRVPPSSVRRLEVVERAPTREGVLALVTQATQHLPRAG